MCHVHTTGKALPSAVAGTSNSLLLISSLNLLPLCHIALPWVLLVCHPRSLRCGALQGRSPWR